MRSVYFYSMGMSKSRQLHEAHDARCGPASDSEYQMVEYEAITRRDYYFIL